jgi:hypothetical protein
MIAPPGAADIRAEPSVNDKSPMALHIPTITRAYSTDTHQELQQHTRSSEQFRDAIISPTTFGTLQRMKPIDDIC